MSFKVDVINILLNFTGKHRVLEQTVKFARFLRTFCFTEHHQWLLLYVFFVKLLTDSNS